MFGRRLQTITTVFVVAVLCWVHAAEYQWTRHTIDYQSHARRLDGHVVITYENVFIVTQCARRCQLLRACASYNFQSVLHRCEINSASHVTDPDDVIDSDHWQYYQRDAYTTDPTALGPCASDPCQNGGTCLTTSSDDGSLTALCLCTDEWTGPDCSQTAASLPSWGDWTDWGTCSSSCGDGVKTRRRPCVDQTTGQTVSSQLCYGADQELMYCKGVSCPAWSDYSDWGECSTDDRCGRGTKMRTRTCTNGGTAGVDRLCKGPSNQTTVCQSPSCDAAVRLVGGSTYGEGRVNIYNDVTQQWMPVCATGWTKTDADVICRQLGFFSGAAQDFSDDYGAQPAASVAVPSVRCQGNEASLATCPHGSWHDTTCAAGPHAGVKCIVDGRWGPWEDWGQCSVTCGDGISTRSRQCNWPAAQRGGTPCSGDSTETKPCTMSPCPVDATWSDWTDWSTCSVTCGGGTQSRSRTCTPGRHGGSDCVGEATQTQACNEQHCPVDGKFSDWSEWDACTVTCGNGTHSRRRQCTPPQYGGQACVGDTIETQACFDRFCPVDGVWDDWTDWSTCNATCGGGTKYRTRNCDGPYHGGQDCVGEPREVQFCSDNPCPVDGEWSEWTRWLECSVTCGEGTQRRYRVCYGASNGGRTCNGNADEYQSCDAGPCAVNCTWSEWRDWTACNATCGNGVRTRSRDQVPAQHGGAECTGDAIQIEDCATDPCTIPGDWLPWSQWSQCSVTCGTGGQRSRTRTCDMTSHGSLTTDCLPENGVGDTETKACHQFSCTPTAASCSELYTRGLEDNTYATIDTDGSRYLQPFTVYCQRNGTTAYTIVSTAQETETKVQGYEGPCEFYSDVQYKDNQDNVVDISQVIALVDSSTSCRQLVKWRCLEANINSGAKSLTYWLNRNGDGTGYWGGASPVPVGSTSTVMCACGETASCGEPERRCFCDTNDQVWRVDEGYITNRPDLPVRGFCAGDTGKKSEQGYYVVGPLICS